MLSNNQTLYFDIAIQHSSREFGESLFRLIGNNSAHRPLVFLCIGSDRATGDCLGPLIGQQLSAAVRNTPYYVYGTLAAPVHAINLPDTMEQIYRTHRNPLVIAIDASLGKSTHIGCYTLGKGPLKPGAGVDKDLPPVGDFSITGIVNSSGMLDQMRLQTTRLNTVMLISEQITVGIQHFLDLRKCNLAIAQ